MFRLFIPSRQDGAEDFQHQRSVVLVSMVGSHQPARQESHNEPRRNLEASVRSRDTDDAARFERDFIEAGLN